VRGDVEYDSRDSSAREGEPSGEEADGDGSGECDFDFDSTSADRRALISMEGDACVRTTPGVV
jgi:hypothetical protein